VVKRRAGGAAAATIRGDGCRWVRSGISTVPAWGGAAPILRRVDRDGNRGSRGAAGGLIWLFDLACESGVAMIRAGRNKGVGIGLQQRLGPFS
jgi:hypothetical protein